MSQPRKGQIIPVEDKDEIAINGLTRWYFYVLLGFNAVFALIFYTGAFEWAFGRYYTLDVILVVAMSMSNVTGIFIFKALGKQK